MDNTWIKLYRKAMEHPVFRDDSAWRVWTWILMSVDYETGEMTLGRFVASDCLGINPNTFKSILDRLRKKYDLIETTNKYSHTTLKVKNWSKYQTSSPTVVDNSEVTPQRSYVDNSEPSPQLSPQDENEITALEEEEPIVNVEEKIEPSPLLSPLISPQVVTTSFTTNQEVKNNTRTREIENIEINTCSNEQEQQGAAPAFVEEAEMIKFWEGAEDKPSSGPPVNGQPEPDGSYGTPGLDEGMKLLEELLGTKLPKDKRDLNRYALNRLINTKGKDKVFSAIRAAFNLHKVRFAPKLYNYLDLEERWKKLEDYVDSVTAPSQGIRVQPTTSSESKNYGNTMGGVVTWATQSMGTI
jgi:hypothetical protein